jgi:ubiquinone/menaquinone biosynthesis C-methylase UbiE
MQHRTTAPHGVVAPTQPKPQRKHARETFFVGDARENVMQDIHQGFQDVNRVTNVDEFFQFLDAVDALESTQAYRQQMLDMCPPTPGQRILDVGCGIGHSTLHLAPLVGATGWVVGLDKSEPFITEARQRAAELAAPLTYQVGDTRCLDFAPQSFDVCRTERVLMYLDQPQQALNEMLRVLRPGGRFVLFELDYEGIIVDAPDQALTRRLVRLVADSVPSPWIGRQLPRLLRERGGHALTVIPHMILTPYALYHRVVSGTIAQAVQKGQLAAVAVDRWWHALAQAETAGHFLAGFPGFLVYGHAS